MTSNNISNNFVRKVMAYQNVRPMGALLFTDPGYPDTSEEYKVSLTSTEIGIFVVGSDPFVTNYIDKSTEQVASDLNNSPFPVEVKSLSKIQYLKEGELLSSGASIPSGFNSLDLGTDGKSAIVRAKRWAVQNNRLAAVQVKAPYADGPTIPWWPRISSGSFNQRVNGINYMFSVPEYTRQAWSPTAGFPFRDVEGEQVNFTGKNKIKLSRSPIYWKGNNIVITNVDNSRVYPSSVIKDVDTINGIVYLNENVSIPKDSLIFYTYLERHFIYKGINVNAHFSQNPSLIDRYVVLYMLPTSSNSGLERDRGIYHSIGNSIPEAIENINTLSMEEPLAILGALHISPAISMDQANIVDTRSFGGGLREDEFGDKAQKKFPITQYFNDLSTYDGIPYHGSAAVVIELPRQLTSVMTLAEIKKATKKFVAKGVYTIIDFVDDVRYWQQESNNAEVSLIQHGVRAREEEERLNLLNFSDSFRGSGDASLAGLPSPWKYSPDTSTSNGEGLSGAVETSLVNSLGKASAWNLTLADDATDYNYLTRSEYNLYQSGISSYYEGDLGVFTETQVLTVEVKQSTSEYFSIHFIDEETSEEFGSDYKWVGGVPSALSNNTNISTRFLRDDWWRCSYSFETGGNFLSKRRNIAIRPVASGDTSAYPVENQYGSGIYISNVQVSDFKDPELRQIVPYLYSSLTQDPTETSYRDSQDKKLGLTGESLGWINNDQTLPADLTTGYHALTLNEFPKIKFNDEINLSPGEGYYIKYLKGSPHSRIFWEELDNDGRWIKKTHYDKRSINKDTIAAGRLAFSDRGSIVARNLTGFCAFSLQDRDTFVDAVVGELNTIVDDTKLLSYDVNGYMFITGTLTEITTGLTTDIVGSVGEISPVTQPVYKSLLTNYNYLSNARLFSSYDDQANLLIKRGTFFSEATHGVRGYPQRFIIGIDTFNGHNSQDYNFIEELYIYSKFVKDCMGEHLALSGEASLINRVDLERIQSGAFRLATQIESVTAASNGYDIGTDIRAPFYNPNADTETALFGDYAEMSTGLSNMHLASEYIKGFAALYATQDRPTSVGLSGYVYLPFTFSPLMIAASGIAHVIHNFERYIEYPTYEGVPKDLNWLYTYNRLDLLAGRFLRNISEAFDDIYYGNAEWAGWSGANGNDTKLGPWADEALTGASVTDFSFRLDTAFDDPLTWPDRKTRKLRVQLGHMVSGYKRITDRLRPMVSSMATRGGIMTPEHSDLAKSYLWIPKHAALGDTYFSGYFDEKDVETFEDCMGSMVKGLFSEDGRCLEGVTFKQDYIGKTYLPSDILYNSLDGVDYYETLGDTDNANRWLAITQGIWNTVTGLYKNELGYPVEVLYSSTSGDLGSRLTDSMCRIAGLRTKPYTPREVYNITGQDTSRL